MAPADLRALQGSGGTHVDVRATAQAPATQAPVHPSVAAPPVAFAPPANAGTAAGVSPAPAAPQYAPEAPAFVERGITAADIAAAGPLPPPVAPTPLGPPVIGAAQPQWATDADRLAKTRIVHRAPAMRVAKESTGSFDLARASFGRSSKRTLWMGIGTGVIALAAVGIWAASGGQEMPTAPTPPVMAKTVERQVPEIPPPPPDTTPAAVTAPPKTVPVAALPPAAPVAAPVQTSVAPPPAPPVVRPVTPPAPAPAHPVFAAPTPRPAARPKAGAGTIVHDVPF